MECKFLDTYTAELDGESVEVWHCRKRDPFVLGNSREMAQATCSSCRLSDYTRPPAELAVEVARRNKELVALNSIVAVVNASMDLDTVLNTGLDTILEILQVDAGWVSMADGDGFTMSVHRGVSPAFAEAARRRAVGEGIVGVVAEAQETVVFDMDDSPVPLPDARREGLVSLLGVPLKAQGQLLAAFVAASRSVRQFSADDIYFAAAAGTQLAAAIERALLFREQDRRIERERRLLESAETVNRSLDSHAVTLTILAEAARLLEAQKSALLVVRGDSLVAEEVYRLTDDFRRLFILPVDDSMSGRAIIEGQTVAVEDVDDEQLVDAELVMEGGFRSFLTAPLSSAKGAYGALSVYYDDPREFTDDDRTLLRTFAVQAAIALDNRRLMHEKDQMAIRDGLTGIFNRSYLEMTLERTIRQLRRKGGTASVLFLDVDDLKSVNDGLGHQAGDDLLQEMAGVLTGSCRECDVVARYGGDEFVVLMPDTGEDGARAVSDKIINAIRTRNEGRPGAPRLSASMGMHSAGGRGVETLLQEADRRMYAMKRARQRR
jgi:eukaryotic-like serine/threonine-protein kinase